MRAPLVPIALAFIGGIVLQTLLPLPAASAVSVAFACLLLSSPRDASLRGAAVIVLWVSLGMFRMALWQQHPEHRLSEIVTAEPALMRVHGMIAGDPLPGGGLWDSNTQQGVLRLQHAVQDGAWRPMDGRLLLTIHQPKRPLRYGDELLLEGLVSRLPAPSTDAQSAWVAGLSRRRISGRMVARPYHGVVILRRSGGAWWNTAAYAARRRCERLMRRHLTAGDAGMLRSAVLGERVALDPALKEAFVETGTMHLVVISGANVALIIWLLGLALRPSGLPWQARLLVIAAALPAYALITGWQPPVVRAMVMGWIVLGAQALDRVLSWSNALAAAALVILCADPVQWRDPSFQLSFGAVLSLLLFGSLGIRWCRRMLGWLSPSWLQRYVAASLGATAAVWVGLMPLLAFYFHLVTPVSLLANVVIAPLIGLLVVIGTAALLLGAAAPGMFAAASGALAALLAVTRWSLAWLHAIPAGHLAVTPSPWMIAAYYAALLAAMIAFRRRGLTEAARDATMSK